MTSTEHLLSQGERIPEYVDQRFPCYIAGSLDNMPGLEKMRLAGNTYDMEQYGAFLMYCLSNVSMKRVLVGTADEQFVMAVLGEVCEEGLAVFSPAGDDEDACTAGPSAGSEEEEEEGDASGAYVDSGPVESAQEDLVLPLDSQAASPE